MKMLCHKVQMYIINRLQPMMFEHAFRSDKVGQQQVYLLQKLREFSPMGKGDQIYKPI